MNSEVLQALIAAGVRPADAGRLATAIDSAYKSGPATSSFTKDAGVGLQASQTPDRFALYASASGTSLAGEDSQGRTLYGPGGAALGVTGASLLDGDLAVTGNAQVGHLRSETNLQVAGEIASSTASFRDTLQVSDRVSVSDRGLVSSAPVVSQSTLVSNTNSQLSGDTVFLGAVSLPSQQNVGGVEVAPTTVQVLGAVAGGGNTVFFMPVEIDVLSSHGTGVPSAFAFEVSGFSAAINTATGVNLSQDTAAFLTSVTPTTTNLPIPSNVTIPAAPAFNYVTSAVGTVTPSSGSVTIPTYATVPPYTFSAVESALASVTATNTTALGSLTLNAISVDIPVSATLDPETCAITFSTTPITVITSITENNVTVVGSISSSSAAATSHTVGDDGNALLGGGSPYTVVTAVASTAASTATASGLGASGTQDLGGVVPQSVVSAVSSANATALTNVSATLDTAPVNVTGSGAISINVTQNGL